MLVRVEWVAAGHTVVVLPPGERPIDGSRNQTDPISALAESLAVSGLVDASALWEPEFWEASSWQPHAPFLFWLIGAQRPRTYVEVGAAIGFSYAAACQAVQRHATGTRCCAVARELEEREVSARHAFTELHDRRFSAFSTLLHDAGGEPPATIPDGSVDLLHLDGRRFYADLMHDFESWASKLSSSGVLLLHGTSAREDEFSAGRFMRELQQTYAAFELPHGQGLGVVAVGEAPSSAISALVELADDAEEAVSIQRLYARLGAAIERDQWRRAAEEAGQGAEGAEHARRQAEREVVELQESVAMLRSSLARQSAIAERAKRSLAVAAQPRFPRFRHLLRNPLRLPAATVMLARAVLDRRLLAASPLFDARWYREQYPDVVAVARDPAIHYLMSGASEGRDPGPRFSTTMYLMQHGDVAAAGMNPLVHYLRHGAATGRSIWPSRRRNGGR